MEQLLPAHNASKSLLFALLAQIETKALAAVANARNAAAATKLDIEMLDVAPEEEICGPAPSPVVLPVMDLIEVEIYLFLYVLAGLMKYKLAQEALDTVGKVVARCQQFNSTLR